MRLSMFVHFTLLVPVFSDITLLSKATMGESGACFSSAFYNRVRSLSESIPELKSFAVKEVPTGNTTVLSCLSNDLKHNFMFWLFNGTDVIGPGNTYNQEKYKYNVLSGDLHIYDVSPKESGYYHCISKKLDGVGFSVGQIDMIVTGAGFTPIDALKLVAIILSIIVIIGCVALYFHLKEDWRKYDGRAVVVPVDEIEEDDDGGDEIYNRTTTSIKQPSPQPGPSRNPSSEQLLYGIDNQGLDTDFNSVFENIQIKSPQRSLI